MTFLMLFWEFFKTGLFAVGGGLATLPFLRDIAARFDWFTLDQLSDMIAVSEATPGPIGVNMATYVGFELMGLPGTLIATLGLVTPSFLVILVIAAALRSFRDNRYVDAAFYTLRPTSVGLIAAAGWGIFTLVLTDRAAFAASGSVFSLFRWGNLVLFAVIWVLTNLVKPLKKLHPVLFLALAAAAGIIFRMGGA